MDSKSSHSVSPSPHPSTPTLRGSGKKLFQLTPLPQQKQPSSVQSKEPSTVSFKLETEVPGKAAYDPQVRKDHAAAMSSSSSPDYLTEGLERHSRADSGESTKELIKFLSSERGLPEFTPHTRMERPTRVSHGTNPRVILNLTDATANENLDITDDAFRTQSYSRFAEDSSRTIEGSATTVARMSASRFSQPNPEAYDGHAVVEELHETLDDYDQKLQSAIQNFRQSLPDPSENGNQPAFRFSPTLVGKTANFH